jgi:hypothetical protein
VQCSAVQSTWKSLYFVALDPARTQYLKMTSAVPAATSRFPVAGHTAIPAAGCFTASSIISRLREPWCEGVSPGTRARMGWPAASGLHQFR